MDLSPTQPPAASNQSFGRLLDLYHPCETSLPKFNSLLLSGPLFAPADILLFSLPTNKEQVADLVRPPTIHNNHVAFSPISND